MNKDSCCVNASEYEKRKKKLPLALIYCKSDIFNENVNVLSEFESFKWALSGLSQSGMIL